MVKKKKLSEIEIENICFRKSNDSSNVETACVKKKLLPPPRKKSTIDKYETTETRDLDTKTLQGLVLLEQWNTVRLQGEYFKYKLKIYIEDSHALIIIF